MQSWTYPGGSQTPRSTASPSSRHACPSTQPFPTLPWGALNRRTGGLLPEEGESDAEKVPTKCFLHGIKPPTCTRTRIYMYAHTYIHVRAHTCMCMHICVHTCTRTLACTHMYIHVHTRAHSPTSSIGRSLGPRTHSVDPRSPM